MLVISRKIQQSIDIDGPARIVVIRNSKGRAVLGIIAHTSVKILRTELIEENKDKAA